MSSTILHEPICRPSTAATHQDQGCHHRAGEEIGPDPGAQVPPRRPAVRAQHGGAARRARAAAAGARRARPQPARAARAHPQGGGPTGRRVGAPPGQPRVGHRQRVDPDPAAGGAGAAVLAGRTGGRRHHLVARVVVDPRAARAAQRGRPAARAHRAGRDVRHRGDAQARSHRIALVGPARRRQVHARPDAGRRPGLPVRRAVAARSRSSPAARSARSTTSTAPTPIAATSGARSKRRSRSTPRW